MTGNEAIQTLRSIFPKGSVAYVVLRSVAKSGMSRTLSVLAVENGKLRNVDHLINAAGLYRFAKREGLTVKGCGMNMGFAVVYDIASAVHGDGYAIKHEWI